MLYSRGDFFSYEVAVSSKITFCFNFIIHIVLVFFSVNGFFIYFLIHQTQYNLFAKYLFPRQMPFRVLYVKWGLTCKMSEWPEALHILSSIMLLPSALNTHTYILILFHWATFTIRMTQNTCIKYLKKLFILHKTCFWYIFVVFVINIIC